MTATFGAISEYMLESKASRAEEREQARQEILKMSETMKAEDGLLNHVQAATLLGVSVKRVSELVRLRKLTRHNFMGRTYVSVKELMARYREEIAAGERIRESIPKRLVKVGTAFLQTDDLQMKHALKEANRENNESRRRALNEMKETVVKIGKGIVKDSVRVPVKRKRVQK
jgi:chromosome condensin MukBEF MukE localization factor